MGYPVSGRSIFVYPINQRNNTVHNSSVNSISIHKCKDLHLSLISSKSSISTKSNKISHVNFSSEHNGQVENGNISSPKTPSLTRSKFSSPCSSQPTSPRHTETKLNLFESSSDFCNIRQVLEDETGKKLLQTCTMSLLYSHYLLCGNLVVIPIFSELCIFKIVGAEEVSENGNNEDFERNNGSFLQSQNIYGHVDAFFVDHGTKVHLETSEKTNFDLRSEVSTDDVVVDIPKLGGLSKEYSVLKDIIVSSSIKNTLSRYVHKTSLIFSQILSFFGHFIY